MVRTRFAPSPTGFLHIGGVRTALFNWLFARQHGGHFILRIDDTDQQRNVEAALQPILDGFRWLGIDWDEGPEVGGPHEPYYQSQRSDRYAAAVGKLLERDFAYRDYATTDEIQAERDTAKTEKQSFAYSRRWMAETDEQATRFEAEGRKAVVRLKMPREGRCQFHDLVRGDVEFDWAREQDHVIQRADGSCLYHLATVVDDHDLQITHVIRAEEHLSNTPRQIFITEALGYEVPRFAHLPYVAEPGGTAKLSKRKLEKYLKNAEFKKLNGHGCAIADSIGLSTDAATFNPVVVDFYRDVGYLPDALVNYLLLLGWSLDDKTEEFTREEMIRSFSLERVNKAPASFDPQKLWAFQARYMLALPMKRKVAMVLPYLQKAGLVESPPPCDISAKLTNVLEAAGDRIKTAGDILDYPEFFVADDALTYVEKDFEKRLRKPAEAAELLKKFKGCLADTEPFEAARIEKLIKGNEDEGVTGFLEAEQIKIGQIIHALRVAVTGKSVGLGIFETLEILGREVCLARIDRALSQV